MLPSSRHRTSDCRCALPGCGTWSRSLAVFPQLVTRRRDPANRRLHLVELTPAGDALFLRLRDAAAAFDRRLRGGLSEDEVGQLEALLTRLRDNVSGG